MGNRWLEPGKPGTGREYFSGQRVQLMIETLPMSFVTVPIEFSDPINAKILEVSEDRVQGFQRDPLGEISRLSGVELPIVMERIHAMLRAGNIRRVRQTLLATNLAQGALVAWQVPEAKLNAAFDWMFQQDPFSGHLFVFFNRPRDRVKLLFWDRSGFCLYYKRLERGTFHFRCEETHAEIDGAELLLILEGIELSAATRQKRYIRPNRVK